MWGLNRNSTRSIQQNSSGQYVQKWPGDPNSDHTWNARYGVDTTYSELLRDTVQ